MEQDMNEGLDVGAAAQSSSVALQRAARMVSRVARAVAHHLWRAGVVVKVTLEVLGEHLVEHVRAGGRRAAIAVGACATCALVLALALTTLAVGISHAPSAPSPVQSTGQSKAKATAARKAKAKAKAVPALLSTSDPKKTWKKGTVPHLYQTDSAWRDIAYAGSTIRVSGCGPTSLAMVYIGLTGKTDQNPATLAQFSEQHGYVQQGLTAWELMTRGAAQLGLTSHEVPAATSSVTAELQAGHPVIASMRPGSMFTMVGHFLVLTGLDANGRVIVNDPNSKLNSAIAWDLNVVLKQSVGLWSYTAA